MAMRVLVTGAAGFVGPYVVRALAEAGHAAWGSGLEAHAPGGVERWFRWDVRGDEGLDAVFAARPDAIVHLAGQSSAAQSFADPVGTAEVNFQGTLRLLDAARRAGFEGALVVAGSSEAYGRLPEGRPCGEDQPLGPVSPYGVSKAAADLAARMYAATFGLRAVVARAFSHTGAGQSTAFALASWAAQVAAFEARAAAGGSGPFQLRVGNLEPVRDYSDVRDVARAYVALAERGEAGCAYNVASGTGRRLREVLAGLTARARVRIEVVEEAARLRPNDLSYVVGDPARLIAATGWTPRHPFEDTLTHLLDGARAAQAAGAGRTA